LEIYTSVYTAEGAEVAAPTSVVLDANRQTAALANGGYALTWSEALCSAFDGATYPRRLPTLIAVADVLSVMVTSPVLRSRQGAETS
jgi:hypothetical protein